MNVTINRQKKWSSYFACNTDLRPKQLAAWSINKWQFLCINYTSRAFFGKSMKIMLVLTNYVKNYASTNYQSLLVTCVSCSQEVKTLSAGCYLITSFRNVSFFISLMNPRRMQREGSNQNSFLFIYRRSSWHLVNCS